MGMKICDGQHTGDFVYQNIIPGFMIGYNHIVQMKVFGIDGIVKIKDCFGTKIDENSSIAIE